MARTGGMPHADVAFEPWTQNKLAIVDQGGHWTVWDLAAEADSATAYQATLRFEGWIHEDHETSYVENGPTIQDDGWGYIAWAGRVRPRTLFVCNRTYIQTFDLSSARSPPHIAPAPDLTHSSGWILDVKRSPADAAHFFVLTSSEIIWLGITDSHDRADHANGIAPGAEILLSWRHFRDHEDLSLHMAVTLNQNGKLMYILPWRTLP